MIFREAALSLNPSAVKQGASAVSVIELPPKFVSAYKTTSKPLETCIEDKSLFKNPSLKILGYSPSESEMLVP